MSNEDREKSNFKDESILETASEKHIHIPWRKLPIDSPIKNFAATQSFYYVESSEIYEWCEDVLTMLSNAKSLDDLNHSKIPPTVGDWYVCAQLLKSGFEIPPELIGELLEKVIDEAFKAKLKIPSLGKFNAKRGRPTNQRVRSQYIGWLTHKIDQLTTTEGLNMTEAYKSIAEEKNKSPDTIRRDYERYMKKHRER